MHLYSCINPKQVHANRVIWQTLKIQTRMPEGVAEHSFRYFKNTMVDDIVITCIVSSVTPDHPKLWIIFGARVRGWFYKNFVLKIQGPLPDTSGHFWLMVWEQNSKAILMLNRIIEKGQVRITSYRRSFYKCWEFMQLIMELSINHSFIKLIIVALFIQWL